MKGKLEALLQNMSDGVIAFDENGELIHANPSGQDSFKNILEHCFLVMTLIRKLVINF